MKYRITENPQVGSDPIFWIEAWGHRLNISIWSTKNIGCWCLVNENGDPLHLGYGSWGDKYLGSFKSMEEAKEYLDKIIEYQKKEVKTVFEIET